VADYEGSVDLGGVTVLEVLGQLKLDARKDVVGDLEVLEAHITNIECDSAITLILERSEIDKASRNVGVLPVRVCQVFGIKLDVCARESSWDKLVEYSETISSVGVGNII